MQKKTLSSWLKIAISSGIPSKKKTNTTDSRVQTLCSSKLHVPGSHGNVYWPKISGRGGGGNAFTNKKTTDVSIPSIYHGKVEKYPNSKENIYGRNPLFLTSMIVGGRATANLRELIVSRLWLSQMQQFDQYLPPGILHLTYLSVTISLSRNKFNSFIAKMELQCLCVGCLQLSANISNINNNPELLTRDVERFGTRMQYKYPNKYMFISKCKSPPKTKILCPKSVLSIHLPKKRMFINLDPSSSQKTGGKKIQNNKKTSKNRRHHQ